MCLYTLYIIAFKNVLAEVSWVAVVALKVPLFNTSQQLIFLIIICADLPSSCKYFRPVNSREGLSKQEWLRVHGEENDLKLVTVHCFNNFN